MAQQLCHLVRSRGGAIATSPGWAELCRVRLHGIHGQQLPAVRSLWHFRHPFPGGRAYALQAHQHQPAPEHGGAFSKAFTSQWSLYSDQEVVEQLRQHPDLTLREVIRQLDARVGSAPAEASGELMAQSAGEGPHQYVTNRGVPAVSGAGTSFVSSDKADQEGGERELGLRAPEAPQQGGLLVRQEGPGASPGQPVPEPQERAVEQTVAAGQAPGQKGSGEAAAEQRGSQVRAGPPMPWPPGLPPDYGPRFDREPGSWDLTVPWLQPLQTPRAAELRTGGDWPVPHYVDAEGRRLFHVEGREYPVELHLLSNHLKPVVDQFTEEWVLACRPPWAQIQVGPNESGEQPRVVGIDFWGLFLDYGFWDIRLGALLPTFGQGRIPVEVLNYRKAFTKVMKDQRHRLRVRRKKAGMDTDWWGSQGQEADVAERTTQESSQGKSSGFPPGATAVPRCAPEAPGLLMRPSLAWSLDHKLRPRQQKQGQEKGEEEELGQEPLAQIPSATHGDAPAASEASSPSSTSGRKQRPGKRNVSVARRAAPQSEPGTAAAAAGPGSEDSSAVQGKGIVVTGKVFGPYSRSDMEAIVTKCGGLLRRAVTKETAYLIKGAEAFGLKKLERAKNFGTPVLDWAEFERLVEASGARRVNGGGDQGGRDAEQEQ